MGQNAVPESWVCVVFVSSEHGGGEDSKNKKYPHETSAEMTGSTGSHFGYQGENCW